MLLQSILCALALGVQTTAADSLRQLSPGMPETLLALKARERPGVMREAISDEVARALRAPSDREEALASARRMASAMATVWGDSFLVRRVERIAALRPADRAIQARADSLRRAGVVDFTQRGPATAIRIWHRALSAYRRVGDTAGIGATLDNVAAGLIELDRLDSAEHYLTRARRLAASAGDLRVQAAVTGRLADIAAERGRTVAAKTGYTQSLALKQRIGDDRGVAADLNNLGLLAQDIGDNVEARRQFEAALAMNRSGGRPEAAATNQVNLASLAAVEGDFSKAVALYRDALATWRNRGDDAEVATALYGLAQLEMRRGDYPAARRILLEAITLTERTGSAEDRILARRALADVLAAIGDLQGALDQVNAAQALAVSSEGTQRAQSALALARADLSMRMNGLSEADRWYAEADRIARVGRDRATQGEAQQGRGLLALTMDDEVRATALLSTALRNQGAASNTRAAALTRIALGQAAWLRKDTAAARRHLSKAVADLDRLKDPVAAAEALDVAGEVEREAGSLALAEAHYRAGLRRLAALQSPETLGRLRAGLGLVLRDGGDLDGAARELRAAINAMEATSRSLALAERRSAFRSDKWEMYGQLALIERARGLDNAAFEASEALRAREMHEILARGRVEVAEAPAELVNREQDLRRRLAELTRQPAPGQREVMRGPDLSAESPARQALLRAQDEYADLMLRLRELAPRHAEVVMPRVASWRDVAQRLAPDQAFITYLVNDSTSLAFIITRDSLRTLDLGAGRQELARLIELNRGTLDRGKPDMPWRGVLRSLDEHLIAPLEESGVLRGKAELVIAPHAELHYLPFAALVSAPNPRYLAERYRIAVTPSASVWIALGERAAARPPQGAIALAPRPDALPASRNEVVTITRLLGGAARAQVGTTATEHVLKRVAPEQRVIHLATYGVLNKYNPLFSFVELTPGEGEDGRLEVHEVFGLNLSADLVVLSACQTGLGSGTLADIPPGDDWVGLTRAFLHAGARAVVATLWQVDDWATAAIMERFYQAIGRGVGPVRALAEAQQAMAKDPVTAHPWYWAGFVIAKGADSR